MSIFDRDTERHHAKAIGLAQESLILFEGNVCARCGAKGVPLIKDEQCAGCLMTPVQDVPPVLAKKCPSDQTQEQLNVREALIDMYHRLKVRGLLDTHRGIFIADHDTLNLAVKVMETKVPSEWFKWCQRRCQR